MPARASRYPSIIPAGPPPAMTHVVWIFVAATSNLHDAVNGNDRLAADLHSGIVDANRNSAVAPEIHALPRRVTYAVDLKTASVAQICAHGGVAAAADRIFRNAFAGRERAHVQRRDAVVRLAENDDARRAGRGAQACDSIQIGFDGGDVFRAAEVRHDPHGAGFNAERLSRDARAERGRKRARRVESGDLRSRRPDEDAPGSGALLDVQSEDARRALLAQDV